MFNVSIYKSANTNITSKYISVQQKPKFMRNAKTHDYLIFLLSNNTFLKNHFGFRKNKSTENAI